MGRKMTKNPSWIQFSDDVCGEAIGPTEYDSFLDSLDGPTIPEELLEPLPDHNTPLRQVWIVEHVAVMAEDERRRVIGPHGLTFAKHADMQMQVANLDAARRAAVGDLRDQLTIQHREAEQELDDFECSGRFQTALKHYLEAAGPAFERIAAALPENQAAVLFQQQAAERYEGLKALSRRDNGDTPPVHDKPLAPLVQVKAFQDDAQKKNERPDAQDGQGSDAEYREGRQRQQEGWILGTLKDMGYDPRQLPRSPAGTPGPKAGARSRLTGMTGKVFDKAWQRLRDFGEIADAK